MISRDGRVVYTSAGGNLMNKMAIIDKGEDMGLLCNRKCVHVLDGWFQELLWSIWYMLNLLDSVT